MNTRRVTLERGTRTWALERDTRTCTLGEGHYYKNTGRGTLGLKHWERDPRT